MISSKSNSLKTKECSMFSFLACFALVSGCLPPVTKNVEPLQLTDHPTATAFVHQAVFDIDGFGDNLTEVPSEGLTIVEGYTDDYGLFAESNLSPTFHAVPVTASEGGTHSLVLQWEVESEEKEAQQQIEFAELSNFAVDLNKWFPESMETGPIAYSNNIDVSLLMVDEGGNILSGRGDATLIKDDGESAIQVMDGLLYTYRGHQPQDISIQLPNDQLVSIPSSEGLAEDSITSDWQLTVTGTSTESSDGSGNIGHNLHFGLRLPDGRPFLHELTDVEVVGPDNESGTFADENGSPLRAIDGIDNNGDSGCFGNFRYDPELGTEHDLSFCLGEACAEVTLQGSIETTDGATDCPW
jgi:hypothetical protein